MAPDAPPGGRSFRPGLWLTLCALLAIAVLLGLGTWQLQRLEWKRDLIAERDAQLEVPAIALPDPVEAPEVLEFRRVTLSGRFLHAGELHQGGRTHRKQVGFHLVTPLLLDDGRTLLVDRGWVPPEKREPARRPETLDDGPVALEAVLRRGGWKGRAIFQPDNDPAGNYWIWIDPPAMFAAAEAAGAAVARPVTALYAVAVPADPPAALPAATESRVEIRNDHLEYALTWFALAAALAVIYVLLGFKRDAADDRA